MRTIRCMLENEDKEIYERDRDREGCCGQLAITQKDKEVCRKAKVIEFNPLLAARR